MKKEQKIKYCYCTGEIPGGYFPNENHYEYEEVLKEVEDLKKDILLEIANIKISNGEEIYTKEEIISNILYINNPIKIFKELVDYEDDEPSGSELLGCVKTINILD